MRRIHSWSLVLLLAAAGCQLTEKTVAPGESVVVAQSIISRTRPEQWVLLEYSLAGDVPRGPTGSFAPPQSPRLPISGASITVERHGFAPLDGSVDTLTEAPIVTPGAVASGVYTWQPAIAYQPGEHLQLRIQTPAGEVVSGSTVVPGASAYHIRVGGTEAAHAFQELPLDRLADTLHVGIDPAPGRAMQVEVRNADNQDDLSVFAFTDSLGIAFAGNLINPFEGDSGTVVFRAGREYLLTVALTDTNYYDFVRTRSDPLTGRGFLNHLEGGLGVFGAVEAQSWVLHVTAPQTDAREGQYRLSGSRGGQPVDLVFDLFLDDLASNSSQDAFSAFVSGALDGGAVQRSADGYFFTLDQGAMVLGFNVPADSGSRHYDLHGYPGADGVPFPVEFGNAISLDTLMMVHVK